MRERLVPYPRKKLLSEPMRCMKLEVAKRDTPLMIGSRRNASFERRRTVEVVRDDELIEWSNEIFFLPGLMMYDFQRMKYRLTQAIARVMGIPPADIEQ